MSWSGRRLNSIYYDAAPLSGIEFKYNLADIRTYKSYFNMNTGVVNTYSYVLDGSNIIKETRTGSQAATLYYYYDESGVTGFNYNNADYYYIKNLQGDVIGINNSSGIRVVNYAYYAWGEIFSTTGTLASTVGAANPFRYRSYYYDTETGWYYLNSRYYDPSVGRFINADGIVGANGGLQGFNTFAYCNNNPVMFKDDNGKSLVAAVGIAAFSGAVIGCACQGISDIFTGNEFDLANYGAAALGGAVTGIMTLAGHPISGAAIGTGMTTIWQDFNAGYSLSYTACDVLVSAGLSAVMGKLPLDEVLRTNSTAYKTIFSRGMTGVKNSTRKMSAKVLSKGIANGTFSGTCETVVGIMITDPIVQNTFNGCKTFNDKQNAIDYSEALYWTAIHFPDPTVSTSAYDCAMFRTEFAACTCGLHDDGYN